MFFILLIQKGSPLSLFCELFVLTWRGVLGFWRCEVGIGKDRVSWLVGLCLTKL